MEKVTPKAELAYQELIDICLKIDQKRKLGWLLLYDEEIVSGEIVFKSVFSDKCISFKTSETIYSSIIYYGECSNYGASTFLGECKQAKKHLLKFKLFEPKKIHKISELIKK